MRLGMLEFGFFGEDELEEAIQETFLTLWRKRESLFQHPNIGGWLVKTLRHKLMDRRRKFSSEKSRRSYSLDDKESPESKDSEDTFDTNLLQNDALNDTKKAMEALLGKENAGMFFQYALGRASAKELSEEYHISEACCWVRLSRMRKKLAEHADLFGK